MKKYFLFFAALVIFLLLIGAPARSVYAPVKYRPLLKRFSARYDLDWLLVDALIYHESRFRPQAVSPRGACGLMQLMPATAEETAGKLGWLGFSERQLFNPEINVELGCYYLKTLMAEFPGDLKLALAAYNAGKGNVYRWQRQRKRNLYNKISPAGKPDYARIARSVYPETRKYVVRVLATYQLLRLLNRIWRM